MMASPITLARGIGVNRMTDAHVTCDTHQHADDRGPGHHCCHGAGTSPGKVLDPVCGMSVNPTTAKHRAEHRGLTYFFCSAGCRTKFLGDPERYLDPASAQPAPVAP